MPEDARARRTRPARSALPRPRSAEDAREDTSALVEALLPVAWELVEAVHGRDPERVSQLINSAARLDVIAIILASQMPHASRTSASGRTVDCGTDEGFGEHIRRREPSCAACRSAHAANNDSYRARATDERGLAARRGAVDALFRAPRRRRPLIPPPRS